VRPGNAHGAEGWRSVREPVIARYRERGLRLWFRGDAAFAKPELYDLLEAEGIGYAIRMPATESAAIVLDTVVAWLPEQTPSGRIAPSVP
jgi:hypothetical protein